MENTKEIWKDIEGYEGLYQVSNLGRVKSLERFKKGIYNSVIPVKENILKPHKNSGGYLHVVLYKDGKIKTCRVNRLVAQAFLPNPDNLPQVNHKDENPQNNRVDNLEWCDSEYNNNYGTRLKRCAEKMTNGKLSKKVLQYSLDGQFIKEFPSTHEVQRQIFSSSYICLLLGKIKDKSWLHLAICLKFDFQK